MTNLLQDSWHSDHRLARSRLPRRDSISRRDEVGCLLGAASDHARVCRASPSQLHLRHGVGFPDRFLPGKTRSARTPLARVNRTSPAVAAQQSHRHRSTGAPFPATLWKTTLWHGCEDLEDRTSLPKSRLSSTVRLILRSTPTGPFPRSFPPCTHRPLEADVSADLVAIPRPSVRTSRAESRSPDLFATWRYFRCVGDGRLTGASIFRTDEVTAS
jgi:hypothetical protein